MLITFDKTSTLTADYLRNILSYDASNGLLRWKRSRSNIHAGDVAGCVNGTGYLLVKVDRRAYKAHRLAWLHYYGAWPEAELDHVDGDKLNNAINNLREVSRLQNNWNKRCKGYTKRGDVFSAKIRVNGKTVQLGQFANADAAHAAYVNASLRFHGSFSPYAGGREAGVNSSPATTSPGAQ